jgi:hypothetical protein
VTGFDQGGLQREFHPAEELIKEGKYNQMEVSNLKNIFE